MENKKTTELMSRKSTLKSKLMAAVSMLLVSAIMVSVTTYAWFILSTAPEVKGMSTTVGSNGALEMALLDYAKGDTETLDAILGKVTTNVGDSSAAANKKVEDSNRTWGNLVDLSGEYYGLSSSVMTLYPSALNMDASATGEGVAKKIGSMDSMLKYAAYGTDGRVAELKSDTFATKFSTANNSFLGYNGYGVRAIGTGTNADPIASGFTTAQNNYSNAVDSVKSNALTSLNTYGAAMAQMAVKHAMSEDATFNNTEVQNIVNAKKGLVAAAEQIKASIQNAYNAYYFSKNGEAAPSLEISAITTAVASNSDLTALETLIEKYEALVAELDKISVTVKSETDATYTWSDISGAINAMIDYETLKINGSKVADLRPAGKYVLEHMNDADLETRPEYQLLAGLQENPVISVNNGAYCSVANFVGPYTSKTFNLTINTLFKATGATLSIQKTDSADEYFGAVTAFVTGLSKPANAGSDTAILSTAYGYSVDLAFRTSAADGSKLMLTKAVERVDGATGLQGGGATFTVTKGTDIAKLAKALRVVFIDTETRAILGVAGMDTTPVTGEANVYALHMYSYDVSNEGIITLKAKAEDDTITTLNKDTAKAISALVYVDGGNVDYAMDAVSGSLNLQFCTNVDLQPMNYTNYATAGLTFEGEVTQATVGQTGIVRPTTIKVGNTTLTDAEMNKVTWKSSKEDVATVDKTTGVVAAGSTAGETVITATYTDNSGTHTGSYTLTVKAS